MELGARIAERLDYLQMSQAELARRAAIPQSTVNSLIKRNRRSSPHLVRIARELGTTPAYLTGDTDDPNSEGAGAVVPLTSEEREWLHLLRALPTADRKATMHIVRSLANCVRGPGALTGIEDVEGQG